MFENFILEFRTQNLSLKITTKILKILRQPMLLIASLYSNFSQLNEE